jgi:hypothetical protein
MSVRLSRKILAGLAMAPLLLLSAPSTAFADPGDPYEDVLCAPPDAVVALGICPSDVVAVVGTGTIFPGLPVMGCAVQTDIEFTALVTVQAGDEGVSATGSLGFSGDSDGNCETLGSGQGSGTLSGSASGTVGYNRTGNVVTVSGTGLTVSGTTEKHDAFAVCVFLPVANDPVKDYGLVCAALLSSK